MSRDKEGSGPDEALAIARETIEAAERLLLQMAEEADTDDEFQTLALVRELILGAKASLKENDGDWSFVLARHALEAAKEAESTIMAGQDEGEGNSVERSTRDVAVETGPDGDQESLSAGERTAFLEDICREWGMSISTAVLEYLAEHIATRDRHEMAEILQRVISASLQTGKPMDKSLVEQVLRDLTAG